MQAGLTVDAVPEGQRVGFYVSLGEFFNGKVDVADPRLALDPPPQRAKRLRRAAPHLPAQAETASLSVGFRCSLLVGWAVQ